MTPDVLSHLNPDQIHAETIISEWDKLGYTLPREIKNEIGILYSKHILKLSDPTITNLTINKAWSGSEYEELVKAISGIKSEPEDQMTFWQEARKVCPQLFTKENDFEFTQQSGGDDAPWQLILNLSPHYRPRMSLNKVSPIIHTLVTVAVANK